MRIRNVHERRIAAAPSSAGRLIDTLGSPDDRLWPGVPAGRWPPVRLDGPLAVGTRGRHAGVRYRVASYAAGRSLAFEFEDEGMSRGLRGGHRFEVAGAGSGALLRHVLEADAVGPAPALRWMVVLRPLHDALLEDLLDRAERELTGTVARPARWSPWARLLYAVLARRGRRRAVAETRRREEHHAARPGGLP